MQVVAKALLPSGVQLVAPVVDLQLLMQRLSYSQPFIVTGAASATREEAMPMVIRLFEGVRHLELSSYQKKFTPSRNMHLQGTVV